MRKAGKAATLPKFSDTLALSQPRGADCAYPLALLGQKNSVIMPLISPIMWFGKTYSFHHGNGPKAIAPFAKNKQIATTCIF